MKNAAKCNTLCEFGAVTSLLLAARAGVESSRACSEKPTQCEQGKLRCEQFDLMWLPGRHRNVLTTARFAGGTAGYTIVCWHSQLATRQFASYTIVCWLHDSLLACADWQTSYQTPSHATSTLTPCVQFISGPCCKDVTSLSHRHIAAVALPLSQSVQETKGLTPILSSDTADLTVLAPTNKGLAIEQLGDAADIREVLCLYPTCLFHCRTSSARSSGVACLSPQSLTANLLIHGHDTHRA